jgi:hypothetical protein
MTYKKTFLLLLLTTAIGLIIGACQYRVEVITPMESEGLLRVGFVNGSESGLEFTLRNISGTTLYYGNGYRLYRHENEQWELAHSQYGSIIYHLEPETVRDYYIEWAEILPNQELAPILIPGGRYLFAKQIFTDPQNLDSFEYFRFEFDLLPWYAWEVTRDWAQERIDAAVLSSASSNVVVIDDVEVSRSGIAFTLENRTNTKYVYGMGWYLAHYIDGRWQSAAARYRRDITAIGLILPGGTIQHYNIEWGYIFDALPPGRYMFIRAYHSQIATEYVMIEFAVERRWP